MVGFLSRFAKGGSALGFIVPRIWGGCQADVLQNESFAVLRSIILFSSVEVEVLADQCQSGIVVWGFVDFVHENSVRCHLVQLEMFVERLSVALTTIVLAEEHCIELHEFCIFDVVHCITPSGFRPCILCVRPVDYVKV